MADSTNPKTIGNMNGPWAILLRLALGTYPLIIAWSVWVTAQEFEDIAFRKQGDRFTQTDGTVLRLDMEKRLSALPPDDWKDRIRMIENNQTAILVKLGVIESKLDKKP